MQAITNAEDFQRALAQPFLARSRHFALHHCASSGLMQPDPPTRARLSLHQKPSAPQPVDNSLENPVDKPVDQRMSIPRSGFVLPKRLAKRAVTRNLLRRQMREVLRDQERSQAGLPGGLWVMRLRSGFDPAAFPSAASASLRRAARAELRWLLDQALSGLGLGRLRPQKAQR